MHEETGIGHGRIETRRIEVAPVGHVQWPGLRQWGRITRIRTYKRTGKTTTEQVCFIASLGESQATPAQLLAYNRNHWGIESKLFWVKDAVLRENASPIRKGAAPQALAALRNLTLRLLRELHPSPTIAREIAADSKNTIIQLLTELIK
jgi:predicted transposase YbfD/YdcC